MRDGSVRSRKGERYKPSAIRGYERTLRLRVLPVLGAMRLSEIERRHVQALADDLVAEGLAPATVLNYLDPLRAIFRRAVQREQVAVNPTTWLDLPRPGGGRDRIAAPEEAAALVAALPTEDRALWATAIYAGLRRGEVRALRWSDVDIAAGVIRVDRTWDDEEGELESGKTRAARRTVPIASQLRRELAAHKLATGRDGPDLVFGSTASSPFEPSTVRRRALAAWRRARLKPIQLHECRHTFASLMIAAGVNAKALSSYMGHASASITFDRYGHLMPGNEAEAAGLLERYLESHCGADGGASPAEEPETQKPTSCSGFASTATGIRSPPRFASWSGFRVLERNPMPLNPAQHRSAPVLTFGQLSANG